MGPFRAAVFLDRDGTVIEERHYLSSPAGVAVIPGAGAAIAALNRAQFAVVLVTNQSGVARGYFDLATVDAIHDHLRQELAIDGGVLDGIFVCPHHEAGVLAEFARACDCRKPLPGMVIQARQALGLDGLPAFVVGDKEVDLALGEAVGCPALLVRTGYGAKLEPVLAAAGRLPTQVVDALPEAVAWILAQLGAARDAGAGQRLATAQAPGGF